MIARARPLDLPKRRRQRDALHAIDRVLLRSWSAGLLCLVVIVFFHSPRWWILQQEMPGSVEWDRALAYLKQCEDPFSTAIEPALRGRFVPQILVRLAGGNRALALALPWVGAWALLVWMFRYAVQQGCERRRALWVTLALGASAPVLCSTGWLGINDAWVALGLCQLAAGRSMPLVALACAVCPLVDERFALGAPGAVAVRFWSELDARGLASVAPRLLLGIALAVLPYVAGRAILGRLGAGTDMAFLLQSLRESRAWLWYAPLGLLMALRFAYLPMAVQAAAMVRRRPIAGLALLGLVLLPVLPGLALASDTMRTAGVLLPFAFWCAVEQARDNKFGSWLGLAAFNLIVPAAHVTYTRIFFIDSLPVELWRLLR